MVRDSDVCTPGTSQLPHIHLPIRQAITILEIPSPIGAAGTAAAVS